jgi:hypothetical protein
MWNRRKVTHFCLPINSLFFYIFLYNLIDEEINVLFIGMLCLRTLEILNFYVVKASILMHFV